MIRVLLYYLFITVLIIVQYFFKCRIFKGVEIRKFFKTPHFCIVTSNIQTKKITLKNY